MRVGEEASAGRQVTLASRSAEHVQLHATTPVHGTAWVRVDDRPTFSSTSTSVSTTGAVCSDMAG